MLEIGNEQDERDRQEESGQQRRPPLPENTRRVELPEQDEQGDHQVGPRGDGLGPDICTDRQSPASAMRDVVRKHRRRHVVGLAGMAGDDLVWQPLPLFAPHEDPAGGALRGKRIEGGLMRTFVEELRKRPLFRPAHGHDVTVDELRHARLGILQIPDHDRFGGADDDTGRLEANLEAMRAEVALLCRVIFGVDEDRIVRAGGNAGLAADADVFVEVDDAVGAAKHRARRTRLDAGGMLALVAARDLKRTPRGRELANVDVLDVRAVDAERDGVLRLACRAAGMAANAAGLVDDFPPLHLFRHSPKGITPTRQRPRLAALLHFY